MRSAPGCRCCWTTSAPVSAFGSATTTGDEAAAQLEASVRAWLRSDTGRLVGLASGVAGLLSRSSPSRRSRSTSPLMHHGSGAASPGCRLPDSGWGEALDTAIEQTGGYFYSRLLLMIVNATLGFGVLVAVGLPWLVALPSAIFQDSPSSFRPWAPTSGRPCPSSSPWALPASGPPSSSSSGGHLSAGGERLAGPRLSARTMEVNRAVAFGAALAGGALGGPMGAFMALPLAALVTAFILTYWAVLPIGARLSARPAAGDRPSGGS